MATKDKPILVFQTDFTYLEGAVSSMYGVVKSVDRELEIFDGTHMIPKFDTWSASFRLLQSLPFWPKGTIYVSVVDPGVGTDRRACAARTADDHIVITPDNGTLTHVAQEIGITEVREIDETVNRLPQTRNTSVFHGRDLFGYTAARLASGIISWEEVGPAYATSEIVMHDLPKAQVTDTGATGIIEIVDPNFGNAWTNISWESLARRKGYAHVRIRHLGSHIFEDRVMMGRSFGDVRQQETVLYCNELMRAALAISQGSFMERYGVGFGPDWHIDISL